MKTSTIISILSAQLLGCSAFDYLQYREDTGLMAVERPDGYGSVKFGEVVAASSTADVDLMAVSAGTGNTTVIYELATNGELAPLDSHLTTNPDESLQGTPETRGSSAAVVGLPVWVNGNFEPVTGCFAVGEPGVGDVLVDCPAVSNKYMILPAPTPNERFGHRLARLRPAEGGGWVLVVAGLHGFGLFSSSRLAPEDIAWFPQRLPLTEEIAGIAAGRLLSPVTAESLAYVAVGTVEPTTSRYRVHVFLQQEAGTESFEPIGCIERSAEPGFGGVMETGDLDLDGSDELVIAAGPVGGRKNVARIYDIPTLLSRHASGAPSVCSGNDWDSVSPSATLAPESTADDVVCGANCGFGGSMSVGDIATDDGGPEIIVGAKRAEVDGVSNAGAVYIFRGWTKGPSDPVIQVPVFGQSGLASIVTHSHPEEGDELGAGTAVAPMAGRNELLIGATGMGKVFVAFCTGVGTDIRAGGDVTRDGTGKVVSTRCRL